MTKEYVQGFLAKCADPYEDWSKNAGYNPRQATFFSKDVAYDGAPARVVRSPDDGMLHVLGPKGNDPSDTFLCSEQEARDLLFGLKKMKTPREKLHDYGKKYERPWTIDQIRKNLGDEIADRLARDPVHRWRSDTGIELIHKEPTKKELLRIIANWKLMSDEQKRLSDEKSRELFGVTNEENARRLLGKRHRETWESGEGEVESYTPDRTEDHDEIVIRLKDGRRVRISNNTRLGKLLRARVGSRVGYHGWRVNGTDVVHRVHPNAHSRGGWLERIRD